MFSIAYSKRSKKIIFSHLNTAVGVYIPTPQEQLDKFCENNNIDADDFIAMEYPYDKNLTVVMGQHLYNPVTGLIEEDPSYVPPAPVVVTPPTE